MTNDDIHIRGESPSRALCGAFETTYYEGPVLGLRGVTCTACLIAEVERLQSTIPRTPGCDACEGENDPEQFVREEHGQDGLVQLTLDGHWTLCRAHADRVLAALRRP